MDTIQVPLVSMVDSTNRKIGTFSDSIAFLDQLKRPETNVDDDEEEEPCHIIGETPLHIAIMYDDLETIKYLIDKRGVNVNQKTMTGKFNGGFNSKGTAKAVEKSEYSLLAYYGEYPLCLAACFASKDVYDYLIDKGADPNMKDTYGNTILHVLAINDNIEMFKYAYYHPKKKAKINEKNDQKMTPFNLAAKLGRIDMFESIVELNAQPFWHYNNVACLAYPLEGIDTCQGDGNIDQTAALPLIINGDTEHHLDMLNIDVISNLLEVKWNSYIQRRFYQRLVQSSIHLIFLSIAVYTRAGDSPNLAIAPTSSGNTIVRYIAEAFTVLFCFFSVFQQVKEIASQGFKPYLNTLFGDPANIMYQLFNFFIIMAFPWRFITLSNPYETAGMVEDTFVILAIPLGWLHLLFYARVFKATGPFVVMIYKMVVGDIAEFSTIYSGFLLGFTLAFYYFYKNAGNNVSSTFGTFPEALHVTFQMSLGAFRYGEFNYVDQMPFLKVIFIIFLVFVPVILMNLLIAMMGNTYCQIIAISEKEWRRQWAHCIIMLEKSFSASDLKKFLSAYCYKVASKRDDSSSEVISFIVTKNQETTKARIKKFANLSWSRLYNKVQKSRRENKCNSSRLLEIWEEKNKPIQVIKVKKEKKAFDWGMYGGNPHKPVVAPNNLRPENFQSTDQKKMDLNDVKRPISSSKEEETKKSSFPKNFDLDTTDLE